MKLYFLRHGDATWPDWQAPDDERPLTKKGKKQIKKVAKFIADEDIGPIAIVSSPLPRACESADIVAEELNAEVTEDPALAPGFDIDRLSTILKAFPGQDVMLVGHEPGLSRVIKALGGGEVRLPKAGLARVDLAEGEELRGELIWLLPAKVI